MIDYTVAIYCFLDDYLKISAPKEDNRRKVNNAEILTTAILAARYFRGNFTIARQYMYEHHGMTRLNKSNFNRHLHRLGARLNAIFMSLGFHAEETQYGESLFDRFISGGGMQKHSHQTMQVIAGGCPSGL